MVFQQEIVLEKIEEILESGVFIPIISRDYQVIGVMMLAQFLIPVEKKVYKGIGVRLQATLSSEEESKVDPRKFLKDRRESLKKHLKQSFLEKTVTFKDGGSYQITNIEDIKVLDINNIVSSLTQGASVFIELIPNFLKDLRKLIREEYSQDYTII